MGEDEQNTWTFSIKMPDGTSIPFSGTIESVEVADMERKVKVGDKVRLIDKPWEWDGWAKLPRPLRLIYIGLMGKEYALEKIMNSVKVSYLQNTICADIDGLYIIPLAILRRVEPVDLPFDFEPEPVKAEPKRVPMTDEPHPEIKEGTKFVVVNRPYNPYLKVGDVLALYKNDKGKCPFFYHNRERRCERWESLAPLETKHRYTPEQIDEAKCYLAEKMLDCDCWAITKPTEAHPVAVISGPLGTGTAKCSQDDEFNRYIGLMVAFKRYHNEPLPTWIRG